MNLEVIVVIGLYMPEMIKPKFTGLGAERFLGDGISIDISSRNATIGR